MATANRDQNRITTIIGTSSTDDETPINIGADSATTELFVKTAGTSSSIAITSPTDFEGAPVTVGTSATEMTFSGTPGSIFLQSDVDNLGKIWVGKSNIDNTGANAMARLTPGESLTIDLNDTTNAIYTVSDTVSQTVFKMATV